MANRYADVFTTFDNSPVVRQFLAVIPNADDSNIVFCYERRKEDRGGQFSVYRNHPQTCDSTIKINPGVDLMSEKVWFVKDSGVYSAVVEFVHDYRPEVIVTPHFPLLSFSSETTPFIPGFQ